MTGVVDKSSTLEQNWRKRLLVVIGLCSVAFCIGIPCTTQVVHAPFCRAVVASHFTPSRSRVQSVGSSATRNGIVAVSLLGRLRSIEINQTCCESRPTEGGMCGGRVRCVVTVG